MIEPRWTLHRRSEAPSGEIDLIHPNGGVAATLYNCNERRGEISIKALAAALNGDTYETLAATSAHAESQRIEIEALRTRLHRLAELERSARRFQAIVADCQQWFNGYRAAFASKPIWKRPSTPDADTLRDLNLALQGVEPETPGPEIPF